MTIALRYAAYSDVGCLREGNEDSAYAGPYLLAVADGMGGHAGGEIASAIAISTIQPLDGDTAGSNMAESLEDAVDAANNTIRLRVQEDPKLENMGTTLTAMLWSGRRIALIHVGDSRAYMLRGGEFSRITHDHTLVQTLVDEGKISEDDVATHPQRSLLLRALNGQGQVDPDVSMREAELGDRYLLCSDGLSGVVSEDTIRDTLRSEDSPEAAARRLIDLANRGGGPDNITAVVADVIDTATHPSGPTTMPDIVGAADQRREPVMTPDTPAGRAQGLARSGDTAEMEPIRDLEPPEPDPPAPAPEYRTKRWWPMVLSFVVAVALVVGVGYYFAQRWLEEQYFIGPDETGTTVALYQGVNTDVAGYSLSEQVEDSEIPLVELPENQQDLITGTIAFDSRSEAEEQLAELRQAAGDEDDETGPDAEEEADAIGEEPGEASEQEALRDAEQQELPGDQ